MKRAGRWAKYEQAVTTATNSNPARFTSPAHGLDPYFSKNFGTGFAKGPVLNISGGTGAWAAVNGRWTATVTLDAPNTFTIPVDTTMFGPMTGKITWAAAPPLIHSAVRKVASGSPAVVTTSVGISSEPDAHRFRDGDPITFSTLNNQYYAKVSGYPANQFAVYSDPNLTQPVDGSAIAAARRNASRLETYFAEKCPTDVPASVTSLMFGDTGAAGVRCFTVRVEGEPCSSFATPAEHASFPCKADLSNPHKSSLQDMEVGDAVRDLSRNVYDETFVLVKKIKYSETNIEATFTRFYGNKIGADSHLSNQSANSHDVGWTPVMVPSNSHGAATGWMDATDRTTTFIPADPAFSGSHNDFGPGNAPGLVTYAGGSPDHINNKTMRDLLATPLTYTKKEYLPWAQAKASQLGDEFLQSYPGHRQSGAPPNAHRWKGDWHALNGDYGDAPTTGSGLIRGQSLKKVNGTKWVYQITNAASVFDRKRTPIYAWSGRYIFRDKSGPHSLIADTDAWTYCIADSAGECRPGSAKNDAFISQPIPPVDTQGWCLSNTINVFAPCLTGINPQAGWAMQKEIDPIDTTAHRTRRLTMGLSAPGMQWTFTTWLQTPGGKWGFFSAPYVNGLRNDYFAMKLPPWLTALEKVDRSTFVPVQRTLAALPGAKYVRARFGYAENGPVWSFFCTSRQETCVTGGDPFCFLSEWSQPLRCDSRCTLSIPAIPGRVLYFVVDRLDSTGRTVSTSPMEAVAIP